VARRQSPAQRKTIRRVMHEWKHGELERPGGRKVRNPRQAIAIALREAGASKYETRGENRRNLRRTKRKERTGKTGQARYEGRAKAGRAVRGHEPTRAELYRDAQRRNIRGRSRMTKAQLARALKR